MVRKSSLWSYVVSRKKLFLAKTFEFDFETTEFDFEVSNSSIRKHTTRCDKGVFSIINISQLWQPIEFKFSQVCYVVHMFRQLPKVSSVFKINKIKEISAITHTTLYVGASNIHYEYSMNEVQSLSFFHPGTFQKTCWCTFKAYFIKTYTLV